MLRLNQYDLQGGERSVFEQELARGGSAGLGQLRCSWGCTALRLRLAALGKHGSNALHAKLC